MSILNLTSYGSLQSNLFIKVSVGNPVTSYLLFSDKLESTVINGDTYVGLGKLLAVSASSSELRSSSSEVTISISGIPDSMIADIVNSNLKGSNIRITRALFNPTTGALLTAITGNPINRFMGYVNNISLEEEYDPDQRTSSNTLLLSCSSNIDILSNKISGRKTNPASMKKFFSTDISMDKVPNLESSYFDFGVKR
jgi:hypothetical protein